MPGHETICSFPALQWEPATPVRPTKVSSHVPDVGDDPKTLTKREISFLIRVTSRNNLVFKIFIFMLAQQCYHL